MFRPYVRVTAAAWTAAALLLTGGGIAAAAPDSGGNKGGGKPSPAASGSANGNSNGNSNGNGNNKTQGNNKPQGNSSGNSGSNGQGNKPANAGNSNGNSQGNSQGANSNGSNGSSGTKTLPDTASPVAQAAVNKEKPTDTGAPSQEATPVPTTAPVPEESVDIPAPTRNTAAQNGAATAAGSESNPQTQPAPAPDAAAVPLSGRGDKRPDAPATAAFTAPRSPAGDVGQVDAPAQEGVPARVGKWIGAAASTIAREVRDALREVTLKDLALAALPGIAGLLFFLATGVGLGHRQARFSFVIETAGALRLAPRGPLGVVGSDSFVHVNVRAAAPRQRALRLVDRAA